MNTSSPFGVRGRRVLSAVAVAGSFAALCALPAAALATTSTSEVTNYSATPTVSTTTSTEATHSSTTTTESKATHSVAPTKEAVSPKKKPSHGVKPKKEELKPAASTTTSTTTAAPAKSSLPFTGLNLAWLVGAGVLLLGLGVSLRVAIRRAH